MKKGAMVFAMLMLIVSFAVAQSVYVGDTITVAAGITNLTTDAVSIHDPGGPVMYREVEEFLVINASGTGTGTVYLISSEIGIDTTIASAGAHVPGASSVNYPLRAFTEQSMAGWVVTGNVAVAKSTVVTGYENYKARTLKVKITQPASATANTYRWAVKAK